MNTPKTDFLSTAERAAIAADVADLLDDQQLSVAVTYKDYQSKTSTPSTGAYVSVYTDYSVRAFRSALSAREIQAGGGLYQAGDVKFRFAASDLPLTPLREDRIVYGADTFEIVHFQDDPLGMFWRIVARRVK